MKCPVCKSGLKITNYHNDYIIEESESECTVCNRYKECFAYGSTEVGVKLDTDWKVWQYDHGTSVADSGRINMEIEQVAEAAHGEWQSKEPQ